MNLERRALMVHRDAAVGQVHAVNLALLEMKERREPQEGRVIREEQEVLEDVDHLVLRGRQERRVLQVGQDLQEGAGGLALQEL